MDRGRDEGIGADDVAPEDVGIDRPMPPTIQDVIGVRLGRREMLRGLVANHFSPGGRRVRPSSSSRSRMGGRDRLMRAAAHRQAMMMTTLRTATVRIVALPAPWQERALSES